MDDKKKKIVIGVMLLAMLGIGAFQFTGGGGSEPAPVAEKKPLTEVKKPAGEILSNGDVGYIEPLQPRDPFTTAELAKAPGTEQEQPKQEKPPKSTGKSTEPGIIGPPIGWDQGTNPLPVPGPDGNGGTSPVRVEPEFKYALVGVVIGDTPAAVFADAAGNQRLITLGGSLDNDTKLISISQGKAVVKFGKKTITLTIGGTASAK